MSTASPSVVTRVDSLIQAESKPLVVLLQFLIAAPPPRMNFRWCWAVTSAKALAEGISRLVFPRAKLTAAAVPEKKKSISKVRGSCWLST